MSFLTSWPAFPVLARPMGHSQDRLRVSLIVLFPARSIRQAVWSLGTGTLSAEATPGGCSGVSGVRRPAAA